MEQGLFATHVRRMRKIYRERRDAFIYEARKYLSGLIDFPGIDAGMDVMGYLQENTSDNELRGGLGPRKSTFRCSRFTRLETVNRVCSLSLRRILRLEYVWELRQF